MPAMNNILVKDDATTPVEFTFVPVSDNPDPFWRSSQASVPLDGQMRLTASSLKQKSGNYKVTAKLEIPVMETLGASGTSFGYVAPPKVAYVNTAIVSFFVDRRSTTSDRANLLKMIGGLLQGADSVTNTGVLNQGSAGDAIKNSARPFVTLFVNLIVPS